MILYVDASDALKLVVEEPESEELATHLEQVLTEGNDLVASMLLFTELHCAADRRGELEPDLVNAVLDTIDLVDLSRQDLGRAGTSAWGLRGADAIHLAVALRLEADVLVAYDAALLSAARRVGLPTLTPG